MLVFTVRKKTSTRTKATLRSQRIGGGKLSPSRADSIGGGKLSPSRADKFSTQ